ncbi:hypothetical protein QCW82_003820 [Klebsiella michiganensis]|nr:hypothetical protein [Klebsiella michiganensis]
MKNEDELTAALATIEKCREITNCPEGVDLQDHLRQLAAENAALKSGIGFFSYGTDSGYEEHATADDAIKAADSDIDYYRGDACDGWSDETDRTVWGVVIQRASMIGLHTETDDSGNKREICDYALLPVVETPATDAYLAGIKADTAAPLVSALTVIANSEQISGETVVCDFDTLVSVAAGALRDYYAQQLREGDE